MVIKRQNVPYTNIRFLVIVNFILLIVCCFLNISTNGWGVLKGSNNNNNNDHTPHRFDDIPTGPLEDAKCNVENVESANNDQLNSLLMELTNTTYFRLFKVDLNNKCPFWKKSETASDSSCGSETDDSTDRSHSGFSSSSSSSSSSLGFQKKDKKKKPTLCSLETHHGTKLPWGPKSAPVAKVVSSPVVNDKKMSGGCKDSSLPEFWLDLCPTTESEDVKKGKDIEYVDLTENLEQFTGYNGSRLWAAIYEENCFSRQKATGREPILGEMCYEERVLYRLLSGMHSAINIHISLKYFPPRKGKRTNWEPNPNRFIELFHHHPERLKNLHFAFVVLLRALRKATPALEKFSIAIGDEKEDLYTKKLMQRLLDSHILHSCGPLFSAFDESQLFQEGSGPGAMADLKKQFKNVFVNVTKILDCVTCQKCKLHGKLQIMGLGTALTILLLPDHLIAQSLSRDDVVSFINTIAKFSDAIYHIRTLSELAEEEEEEKAMEQLLIEKKNSKSNNHFNGAATGGASNTGSVNYPSMNVDENHNYDGAFDVVLDVVSKLAMVGKLSMEDEDKLVDAALVHDSRLGKLIKHYALDPDRFIHHALRTLSKNPIDPVSSTVMDQKEKKPDAIIIGSGLAGLTAALTIVDRGGKVVIVEKQAFMGGNSAYASSGINAAKDNSGAFDDEDSADKFAQDTFKSSGVNSSSSHPANDLIPVLTSHSFSALNWARDRVGVDLSKIGQLGGHSYPRTYRPATGMAGSELIFAISKIIKSFVKSKRVQLKMNTLAKDLLVDPKNGKVIGVKAISSSSSSTDDGDNIYSDNVIIATGGFANDRTNTSMLEKYRPDLVQFATTNGKFATGDGHKMAMRAGGNTVDMENVQVHPTAFIDLKFPNASRKTLCAELLRGVGGLLINNNGKRFVDELGTRKYITEEMVRQKKETNNELLYFNILLSPAMALEADKHVPHYYKKGLLQRYETLEEVANAMNVDFTVLKSTITDYNKAAATVNHIDQFGKKYFKNAPFPLKRDDVGPGAEYYYLGIVTPALHYCMGGVSIDSIGRVMKSNGNIFEGLYAAGEVTGGVHGINRLGGNALTECIVFGKVVGENIEISRSSESATSNTNYNNYDNMKISTETKESSSIKQITKEALSKHNNAKDCWVSIDDKIYDLTDFLEEHPAGPQSILDLAGKDATEIFDSVHTRGMLDDFDVIGELKK